MQIRQDYVMKTLKAKQNKINFGFSPSTGGNEYMKAATVHGSASEQMNVETVVIPRHTILNFTFQSVTES